MKTAKDIFAPTTTKTAAPGDSTYASFWTPRTDVVRYRPGRLEIPTDHVWVLPRDHQPMYETNFRKDGDILRVHITGERTREAVGSVSKEIMEACLREGTRKLLIDVREFQGRLTLVDDYELPAKEFLNLPPHGGLLQASAVVDLPENDARFMLFEDVARSRGFNFRVFDNTDAALKWLNEQEQTR